MNRYFEDPAYLWLLLLVPLLAALWFLMHLRQKHKLRKFGDPELVKLLMPDVSRWRAMVILPIRRYSSPLRLLLLVASR